MIPGGHTLLCDRLCTVGRVYRSEYERGPLPLSAIRWNPHGFSLRGKNKQRLCEAGVSAASESGMSMPHRSLLQRLRKPSGLSFGEELMRLIAGASSAPIAQYIPSPVTLLHSLDPRVKQAWLLVLVFLPSRSHIFVRLGLVLFLSVITVSFLPRQTWQDQLGRMAFFSGLLLVMVSLGADGFPSLVQPRTPPPTVSGIPILPSSFTNYKYVLWKLGPFQLTRKGLALGVTSSCISFIVLQSASLCLSTTMPEHLAEGIRWYLTPLTYLKAPVDEIVLTLLLSLRFIGLVFDEVRNIALGIVARGVQWKKFTALETVEVFFTFLGRVFKNLFIHSEQIAQAMLVRGFRGNAAAHKVYFVTKSSLKLYDYIAVLALGVLVGVGAMSEIFLS